MGRGFVRGDDAGHHHRVQIGVGDDVRHLLLHPDGVFHPAVARRVLAHLLEDFTREFPEIAHGLGHGDLFIDGRAPPGVDHVRDRIFAQGVHVFLGHAQEVKGHRQRRLEQHGLDQIGLAAVDKAIHAFAGHATDHVLVMDQVFRQERVDQNAAAFHVRRLVLVHQRTAHAVVVFLEDRVRLGRVRRHLLERDRRREGDVVAEDRLHVLVAADDPVAQLLAEEDRLAIARPAQGLRRVDLIRPLKHVEGLGSRVERAFARPGSVRDGRRRGAAERAGPSGFRGIADHVVTVHDLPLIIACSFIELLCSKIERIDTTVSRGLRRLSRSDAVAC
ncbi:hypothetical protein D3C80_732220 [compost metagenome]